MHCWLFFIWIINSRLLRFVVLLLLLLSSGINHRFVSVSLGPSINIFLPLITCTLPFSKITVQSASHNTSTDINDLSIFLNPCAFYASIGSSGASSGASYSCRVVIEFIVFVFATPTFISSCSSSFPIYLCLLARNILVAAKSGCPTVMVFVLLLNLSLNLFVRVDRRVILSPHVLVTTAAYD